MAKRPDPPFFRPNLLTGWVRDPTRVCADGGRKSCADITPTQVCCRVPRRGALSLVFPDIFGRFHHIEVYCVDFTLRPADTISSSYQDICCNVQKQDPCSVLWGLSVDQISRIARIFRRACDKLAPSLDPPRRFQFVRGLCTPPIQVGSYCDRYRVR